MKTPLSICYVFSALLMASCAGTTTVPLPSVETVKVTPSVPQEKFFADFVSSIEVIPLETREDLFIRNKRVMELYNGDFYISNVDNGLRDDSRGESNIILRFDKYGKFLNKIGRVSRGNVPGSYYFYANYYLDSIAYIFSFPDFCVNKYTLEGEFISKDTLATMKKYQQAAFFKNSYILSGAYDTPSEGYLLRFYNEYGELLSRNLYLGTKQSSYSRKHKFTKYNDMLFYIDGRKDTIYQISDVGIVSPGLFVDYGEDRRNNKENFLKKEERGLAVYDEYAEKPFADNGLYYESGDYCLLETKECEPKYRIIRRLGLKNKCSGQWVFVDFETENKTFKGAVQFLEGKRLYFLVQARHLAPVPEWMRPYFVNLQVLDGIKAEDNDLLFVFTLK